MKNSIVCMSVLLATPLSTSGKSPVTNAVFDGNFMNWLDVSFKSLDKNEDGKLDGKEVIKKNVFESLDSNKDGSIEALELQTSDSKSFFNLLDVNGDEFWTVGEVPLTLIQAIENHDGFAENNDGKVDLVEFSSYHSSNNTIKKDAKGKSYTEMAILGFAGLIAVSAIVVMYNSWSSTTQSDDKSQAFMGVDEYELEYPPEVAEFQELREKGETDEIVLKRALMKRALATCPMRLYIQAEEKNVQRLYQKSMISPTTWANFRACAEEINMEVQVIKDEAESLKEGWGESIIQEAHWLHANIEMEKKQIEEINNQKRQQYEAIMKAKQQAETEHASKKKMEEQEKMDRERAILELEKEAALEAEKKNKGLTQRKNSGKKK
jgi:translocation protein SEC66